VTEFLNKYRKITARKNGKQHSRSILKAEYTEAQSSELLDFQKLKLSCVNRKYTKEGNMYDMIESSLSDGIMTITIKRPQALNALNREVIEGLILMLEEVDANDQIKGVILTGAGEKAFVAGADIKEMAALSPVEAMELAKLGQHLSKMMEESAKPIIAAINGFCLGGGNELAMAAHLRTAAPNAKFGQPEVNLGLIPGFGGTQRLPRLIGLGRATELILTGAMINAETAYQWGLINHVFDQAELMPKTIELMKSILCKGPQAVAFSLKALYGGQDRPLADALNQEAQLFGLIFSTSDHVEGMNAFIEKRKPDFKGE
jgi:enoyl-CoA hydratase